MSVMTPADFHNPNRQPVDMNGRPIDLQRGIQPVQPNYQRQAVIDQLAPPTAGAPGALPRPAGAPTTGGASPFARGGKVTPLPTAGKREAYGNLAAGVGSQVAGNVLGNAGQSVARQGVNSVAAQVGGGAAKQAASKLTSFGGGAAGAATSAGIGLATGYLADKLKVKEDMPTFGGSNAEYLDDLGRRFEGTGGGVASNALRYAGYGAAAGPIGMGIGAGVGAIKGLASKNAKSAYTDFKVEDAANAIKAEYEKELGRPASDEEVMAQLKGQGFDPNGGDRWVGEKGLNSVMDQIRASPEAQAFKTTGQPATARAEVMNQLGGSASGAADRESSKLGAQGGVPGSAPAPPAGTGTGPIANNALESRGSAPAPPLGSDPGPAAPTGGPAPADGGAGAGVGDTSAWDTDGYSAPAYTPPSAGAAPPGWDAEKWNDPNHQTPKYGVGRILSNFPPTLDGLKSAMGDIEKAYPGTTYDGKDKLTIPGVGTIDVLEAAGEGGKAWRWDDGSGGGEAAAGGSTSAGAGPSADMGEGGDLLAKLQAEIDRIQKGEPNRQAVMSQLGAA